MSKKSITKNYIYNLIYQVLVLILPLITAPYISRILGAENIGIYSYTLSISGYFILFGSLGIALYGQRETAYNQKSKIKYSIVFWEIVILRIITLSISLLIFYITFVKGNQYQIYYKILILEIIGNCIDISWFLQGLEEFKKTVLRNLAIKLIGVMSIFIFVKTQNDLSIYFLVYVMSILIGNLSLWVYLPKFLVKVKLKDLNIFKHLKPTIELFIPQIAIQVYTLLDRTMVGNIVQNKAEVGFYDQGQKIIKVILAIVTSTGTVMLPRIANIFENGNKEQVYSYMKKSFNVVFFMAFPMILGIISIADLFVPVFFGSGYDRVIILMRVISPIILFIGLSNVTGMQYLLPVKKQKEFSNSVIAGAIVNFIMNIILIPKFGSLGASIGTLIAEMTVTGLQMYYVRNIFNIRELIKISKKYFISSIIMFIVCIFLGLVIKNNYVSMIAQIIIGAIIYINCLIILKDSFILDIIKKIKNKVIK